MSDQYPPPGSYPPPGGGGYPPPGGDQPPAYGQQPSSGGGYGQPPTSGSPYGPPSSGGGYGPPPSSGGGYGPPPSGDPYNQPPAYGQPAGAPFGAPPPPPKKSRAGKIILIIVGVIVALVIVCCGGTYIFAKDKWNELVNSSASNAKVGDCLAGDSIGESTSKNVDVKIVKCDDSTAKYKVVGIKDGVSQAESLKNEATVCDSFTEAKYVLWQGTNVASGQALCLDDAK
jgi:hypothetical protein